MQIDNKPIYCTRFGIHTQPGTSIVLRYMISLDFISCYTVRNTTLLKDAHGFDKTPVGGDFNTDLRFSRGQAFMRNTFRTEYQCDRSGNWTQSAIDGISTRHVENPSTYLR